MRDAERLADELEHLAEQRELSTEKTPQANDVRVTQKRNREIMRLALCGFENREIKRGFEGHGFGKLKSNTVSHILAAERERMARNGDFLDDPLEQRLMPNKRRVEGGLAAHADALLVTRGRMTDTHSSAATLEFMVARTAEPFDRISEGEARTSADAWPSWS